MQKELSQYLLVQLVEQGSTQKVLHTLLGSQALFATYQKVYILHLCMHESCIKLALG